MLLQWISNYLTSLDKHNLYLPKWTEANNANPIEVSKRGEFNYETRLSVPARLHALQNSDPEPRNEKRRIVPVEQYEIKVSSSWVRWREAAAARGQQKSRTFVCNHRPRFEPLAALGCIVLKRNRRRCKTAEKVHWRCAGPGRKGGEKRKQGRRAEGEGI